jgi:acetoin utilization deacetylase AcuC-like enzyme
MARVLVCSTERVDEHLNLPGHPERPFRLHAARLGCERPEIASCVTWIDGRDASPTELQRVHSARFLDDLEQFIVSGGGDLDPDTSTSPGSWGTALRAAGAGLAAIEALGANQDATAAFAITRPPGHHAGPASAAGFCLLNNVAVAAAALKARGERVVIVDWDVHHGNGTQAIFWDDPDVLYVSTHQWPAYPGTGRADEVGGPNARGLTINVPLPAGATGDVVREAIVDIAGPAVAAFAPTWALVSAGFDAHRADPLADLALSAGDFGDLAEIVAAYVPPGRLVAVLEGGYDLDALAASVAATVAGLAGVRWSPEKPTAGGPGRDAVEAAMAVIRRA